MVRAGDVGILTAPVRRGNLAITVTEKGNLESSKNEDVICEVEGQTTDHHDPARGDPGHQGRSSSASSTAPRCSDNLTNQKITTQRAEADLQRQEDPARSPRSTSTSTSKGIYPQEIQTAQGEIKLAESEQVRAEDRLDWSDQMVKIGYVSAAQNIADQLTLQKAEFSLEQAQTKKEVLEKYTRDKTIKELQGRGREGPLRRAGQAGDLRAGEGQGGQARRMIENCKLYAPNDGLVVYANEPEQLPAATTSR